jgi:hypothetical protein
MSRAMARQACRKTSISLAASSELSSIGISSGNYPQYEHSAVLIAEDMDGLAFS